MANAKPRESTAGTTGDATAPARPSAAPPGRFGQDVTFTLPNPKVRMFVLGGLLIALGVAPFLIDAKNDPRAAFMKVLGVAIVGVGGWLVWIGVRLLGAKDGAAVVTARDLLITLPRTDTTTVPLETIERVLHTTRGGQRQQMIFETRDGKKYILPAANTVAEDEQVLGGLVLRRAALRRAGVKTRAELAAAEAYLTALALGASPFGVLVWSKKKEVLHVLIADDREDARAAPERVAIGDDAACQLFVPEAVLAVLKDEDPALAGAKPLRGID